MKALVQKAIDEASLFDRALSPFQQMIEKTERQFSEFAKANGIADVLVGTKPAWARLPSFTPEHSESIDDRIERIVEEKLAERDSTLLERDPTLYGRDGVKRRPGFKVTDGEDDEGA